MVISFEASANIDTNSFGYFSMKYDPDLFSDIKENLTEIFKAEPVSFSLSSFHACCRELINSLFLVAASAEIFIETPRTLFQFPKCLCLTL